ncbi:hypothetical protein FA13DRAFT_1719014 [Coprinellus micaceus]|uniref:Uncharacterized protein n=1 Tax=Coprinellus micaceus TaxID=71717 RepID=A0A4Y7SE67_COPMI|nr:hypothetical protein FA13DRAFT_1719014 [Coprinellus micaceus]
MAELCSQLDAASNFSRTTDPETPARYSGDVFRPEYQRGIDPHGGERLAVEGSYEGPATDYYHIIEHALSPRATPSPIPTQEVDDTFLKTSKLRRFDPRRMGVSKLDLLFCLGRVFGPGITRTQFRKVFRQCVLCQHLMFTDRRHSHQCDGPVLQTQEAGFDIVSALTAFEENAGLSRLDVRRLFARCGACKRVCLEGAIYLHHCTTKGSQEFCQ